MKSVIVLYVMLLFISLMSYGCGGLINDCTSIIEINQVIADETDLLTTALTNFSVDQTQENCENVVNAYNRFIDSLKRFQGCANEVGAGTEFAQSLLEAESNLDDFEC